MSAAAARTVPDVATTSVASSGRRWTAAAAGLTAGLMLATAAGISGVPGPNVALIGLMLVALLTGVVASWSP